MGGKVPAIQFGKHGPHYEMLSIPISAYYVQLPATVGFFPTTCFQVDCSTWLFGSRLSYSLMEWRGSYRRSSYGVLHVYSGIACPDSRLCVSSRAKIWVRIPTAVCWHGGKFRCTGSFASGYKVSFFKPGPCFLVSHSLFPFDCR